MMDSQELELYLQKLKCFLFDEEKIITVPWLSKKLSLGISECQELLEQAVKDEQGKLGIVYVITGKLKSSGHAAVANSVHEQLEDKRNLFETSKVFIFSIQKSQSVDLSAVANVDVFVNKNSPLIGTITTKNYVKHGNIIKSELPMVKRASPTDKSKATHLFTKTASSLDVKPKIGTEKSAGSNKELANDKKQSNEPLKVLESTKNKEAPKVKMDKKNSIANMFSNVNVKKAPLKPEIINNENNGHYENESLNDLENNDKAKESEEEANKSVTEKKTRSESKKSAKKNKKRQSIDTNNERPQKRRKRIVEMSDSDDDIFEDDEKGEEIDNLPLAMSDDDEAPVTKALVLKSRKRELVDKTFEDEEGYIVTKKEWVINDEDEEEENKEQNEQQVTTDVVKKETKPEVVAAEKVEKPKGKEVKTRKSGKAGIKKGPSAAQPTIMSFFKRK